MAREVVLYKIPKTLEVARVLDDSILPEYNDSVKSTYNSNKARTTLGKFSKSEGELTGSNPFMLVHLQNSGLINDRIATREDLETALGFNPNILSGNYVCFGLALRTAGDSYSPNDLLAKILAEQLKEKGIKLRKGKLIPISALNLRENSESEYGLVFNLNENLGDVEDLSKFKWDCQGDKGLARAYLSGGGCWNSSGNDLGGSAGSGRVVVVSGEATSQKALNDYLTNLKQKSQKVLPPYTTKDVRAAEREIKKLSKFLQPEKFSSLKSLIGKLR